MEENIIAPDMQKFIDEHRKGLITWVQNKYPNTPVSDDDLETFIINEVELYGMARAFGVDV